MMYLQFGDDLLLPGAKSQFSPGQMPPQLTMAAAEAGSCGSKCKVSRGPARVLHKRRHGCHGMPWDAMGTTGLAWSRSKYGWYPRVMANIQLLKMDHLTIYSEFSHEKWWFSRVMFVYQRVSYWNLGISELRGTSALKSGSQASKLGTWLENKKT